MRFIVVPLLALTCSREPLRTPTAEAFANTILEQVSTRDGSSIAAAFHYPEDSAEARNADRRGVEHLLRVMFSDFGSATIFERMNGTPDSLFVMVASGDVQSLNTNPDFTRYAYKTRFSARGDGYVFVDVVLLNSEPVLRSLCFALPRDRPGAASMIDSTNARMVAVFQ